MPYIRKEERKLSHPDGSHIALSSGHLNYQITILAKNYLDFHKLSYQTINDIVGALEGAKAEFQRRIVVPYEDSKIKENGDVY